MEHKRVGKFGSFSSPVSMRRAARMEPQPTVAQHSSPHAEHNRSIQIFPTEASYSQQREVNRPKLHAHKPKAKLLNHMPGPYNNIFG